MQRAIQNTQAATRRRSCPIRVAGSTLTANVAFAVLKYATLTAAVHENAVAHGWWEQERELPEILMLCVSELAEALEEYRAGKPNIYYNIEGEEILYADGEACEKYERRKPEGVAVELADCMIRILDYCGSRRN